MISSTVFVLFSFQNQKVRQPKSPHRKTQTPIVAKQISSIGKDCPYTKTERICVFTEFNDFIVCAKRLLKKGERVLIIDDFLANGCALKGLISITESAGATVVGCGIVIEKGYQSGGAEIRDLGYQVKSLAIVDAMDSDTGAITFRKQ